MSTPTTTTELAALPERITTGDDFHRALVAWRDKYHVLTPFTSISGIAPMHAAWVSVVQINPDKAAGEIYDGKTETGGKLPWLKDGQVALAKNGLRKIAEGLGVDVTLQHLSVGVVRHYWHVKAVARYHGLDGGIVTREATMEWDLRDGSERLKGFGPAQISEARKNGLRNCETRAINAAIRECGCGIKQAYTREELAKPFVALRVSVTPDYTDPETRRLLVEQSLRGTSALYAGTARHALPPVVEAFADAAPTPQTVGAGATAAASATTAASQQGRRPADVRHPPTTGTAPAEASDAPPSEQAVRIEHTRVKPGESNGRKWTKYVIVDSRGAEHSTFDRAVYEAAERAKTARAWVELSTEQNGQYSNLVELQPAGQQATLLPDPANL